MDVGFGGGPFLFRVAGPTPSMVYQTLYRLLQELIEAERARQRGEGRDGAREATGRPPEAAGMQRNAPRA